MRKKRAGIDDRQAVVRLGGEVDDAIDGVFLEHLLDDLGVADVGVHERHPVDAVDVLAHARVRQRIEGDDVVTGMLFDPVPHEVGADEPGRAGDEDGAHACRSSGAHRPVRPAVGR